MYTVKEKSLKLIADAIRSKAKLTEKLAFPDGFASAIEGIKTGGQVEFIPEKDVNFYDYEGTRIASYTAAEAAALTELPAPPEREGLVFQGWNYTLDEVRASVHGADIGALYTTVDGKTRLYVEIASMERQELYLNLSQTVDGGATVDWGDGTVETLTGMSSKLQHTYGEPGAYTIEIAVPEGDEVTIGSDMLSGALKSSSVRLYMAQLRKVELGDRMHVSGSTFSRAGNLKELSVSEGVTGFGDSTLQGTKLSYVTIPRGVTTLGGHLCDGCTLEHISIPPTVTSIGASAFYGAGLNSLRIPDAVTSLGNYGIYQNDQLTAVVMSSGITDLPNYLCRQCASLVSVTCLGDVTRIRQDVFGYCAALKRLDLTHCTAVPTLDNSGALYSIAADCEILVPAALEETWKAATNWTTYAKYIKGV